MPTSQELYQLVAQLAGLGIWEHNLVTGDFYINNIVREIIELEEGVQPAPDEFLQFYVESDLVSAITEEVMATGLPNILTTQLITPAGKKKWVKLRLQAKLVDGKCRMVYGTLEDVTPEQVVQRLLEEREQQFAQAFTNAPIGMALVGLTGNWIKVNTSLCELLGYPENEFLQHTFQDFTHPEDLEIDLGYVEQLLTGKIRTYSMEKRYFHRSGHTIWALLNVSLIRSNSGEPLYFVSQIKDITDQKKNAETIRGQNERLINFAHIVSHNLRSHTGNIKALTELISSEAGLAEKELLLKMLADSADNLLETIADLNNIVVIQEKNVAQKEWINLHDMVERVRSSLMSSLFRKQAELYNHLDPTLRVMFNPAYLESIFGNLVSNSLRYRHPDRNPEITVSAAEIGDRLQIKVSDNGLGFNMKVYGNKLFGMYKTFHGHPEAKGLGLFLVKTQTEAMESTVTADSIVNTGTTFTIEIPKPLYETH